MLLLALGSVATAGPREPATDPAGPTVFGQRGLYRSWAPLPYEPGEVVIGSTLEFFKASDYLKDGDENQRLLTRSSLAWVPFSGFEINAGFYLASNYNTAYVPDQAQFVGDPFLGVRYGHALTDQLSLGGGVQIQIPTGEKFSQLSTDGISTRVMTTFAFQPVPAAMITLNLGYHFDNTARIFDENLNAAQIFSAGVNPHDQLLVRLGAAWQFGPVAPFLEYGGAIAMGTGAPGFTDTPNWITIGLRAWPLSHHTLHVVAALDIGLTGIHPPAGKGRTPPYNVILALGFNFGQIPDPPPLVITKEVEKIKEVKVQVPPPPQSRIVGTVVDAQTGKPLGGARVEIDGKEAATFVTEPERGAFTTCPADPGPVKMTVSVEGYRQKTTAVLSTGKPTVPVTIKLARIKGKTFGTLKGTVRSATGKALRARIVIPTRRVKTRAKKGKFKFRVKTGVFDVLLTMPGYVTQRRKIKLKTGDIVILNVELYPKK
jgi:5-hydroxyisourate hydrolase-like protein (transthyretin family)